MKVRTICEKQHRFMLHAALTIVVLVLCASQAQGDTITDIAQELSQASTLPLGQGVALELATNLWDAQLASPYAASEPDSLPLSIASVLRAIWLEIYPGGPAEILSYDNAPIPFIQSHIAIDDRVSVEITAGGVDCTAGCVINFGDVPVGETSSTFTVEPIATPEYGGFTLALTGVNLVLVLAWFRRRQ